MYFGYEENMYTQGCNKIMQYTCIYIYYSIVQQTNIYNTRKLDYKKVIFTVIVNKFYGLGMPNQLLFYLFELIDIHGIHLASLLLVNHIFTTLPARNQWAFNSERNQLPRGEQFATQRVIAGGQMASSDLNAQNHGHFLGLDKSSIPKLSIKIRNSSMCNRPILMHLDKLFLLHL